MVVTQSRAVTRGVEVEVEARYSPGHSDPAQSVWFFVYSITITNSSDQAVQLLNRHWEITDGAGQVEHVRGPGVVGEQPVLAPGARHRYSSGCPLSTAFGFMRGEYEMIVTGSGERFEAEVALFPLRIEPENVN